MRKRTSLRTRAVGSFVVLALVGAAGAESASAQATTGKCPGTFQVMHNDKVGKLKLPKGPYTIRVKNMACSSASDYFKQFLDDPNGNLPKGWKLMLKKSKFKNKKGGYSFRVSPANGGGGNNGGGGGSTTGKCPGTFQVMHNDKVGKLKLPKGPYTIRVKNMACSSASDYFKQFLDDPNGNLPKGWKLMLKKSKFKNKKGGYSFRVSPA